VQKNVTHSGSDTCSLWRNVACHRDVLERSSPIPVSTGSSKISKTVKKKEKKTRTMLERPLVLVSYPVLERVLDYVAPEGLPGPTAFPNTE